MGIRLLMKWLKDRLLILRNPLFRLGGTGIGKQTVISKGCNLRNSRIGKYSYVGEYSSLNHVEMGNYCSIAPNVHIGGMEHSYWKVSTSPRLSDAAICDTKTVIGNDVWIGARCYIKGGITIGNGAVIGAQSMVNKDVPPYAIVFGTPARIYKYRFVHDVITAIEKTHYWDMEPSEAKKKIEIVERDYNIGR